MVPDVDLALDSSCHSPSVTMMRSRLYLRVRVCFLLPDYVPFDLDLLLIAFYLSIDMVGYLTFLPVQSVTSQSRAGSQGSLFAMDQGHSVS